MLDQVTKRMIDSARQVLVGKVPDPKAQVDQITTALVYKFMDDMDEEVIEMGGKRSFFGGKFERYRWQHLLDRGLSGNERLDLYTQAINNMPRNDKMPKLFQSIFKNAFLPYHDAETLHLFLKEINGFSYDNSENLGNAFEYLLAILGSQGDAGQFRTPRHVIDFIVEVLDPQKHETILDPACGTAGFLISAYKHIFKNNSSNYDANADSYSFARDEDDALGIYMQSNGRYKGEALSKFDKEKIGNNIVGYDISPDMVKLSQVNMYLHRFVSPKIHEYDTLTHDNRWNEEFDLILANPPFMNPKGGIRPHNRFSITSTRSEVLFVDYIAEHLTINGRAGIIVPEGIIFREGKPYNALRRMLVEDRFLWAVVSLPNGIFQPYSGVKTSILFLDRPRAKATDEILFIDVQKDGFDLGATRRKQGKSDLPVAFDILRAWRNSEQKAHNIAHWTDRKKILASKSCDLSGRKYRLVTEQRKQRWPLVALGEVCDEDRRSIDGKTEESKKLQYLGLDNIESRTGKINLSENETATGSGQSNCFLFDKRHILYGKLRPYLNKVALPDFEGRCTTEAIPILPRKNIHRKLLAYMMRSEVFVEWAMSTKTGSRMPRADMSRLFEIKIPLPPLDLQEEVVAEIEGHQNIIDGAEQILANWKPIIKIDPDWPLVALGEVEHFSIKSGGTPDSKNPDYWDGEVPWVTLVDLPAGNRISNVHITKRRITQEGLDKSSAVLIPTDSVLVSSRATIGRIGISKIPLATNQGFKSVVVKNKSAILPVFVANMLTDKVEEMQAVASGGTFKEISKSKFEEIKIPLPPLDVQEKIVAEIERERALVETSHEVVACFKKKIAAVINDVWGYTEDGVEHG